MTGRHAGSSAPPDRPPYVAFPRTLINDPSFNSLSRDAQWLIQYLERDPHRLKSGVMLYCPRIVARDAKASEGEVDEWLLELRGAGWVVADEDSGEIFLTQHMDWDFTMPAESNAKSVLKDLVRIRSTILGDLVRDDVYSAFPNLNPRHGIDPGWGPIGTGARSGGSGGGETGGSGGGGTEEPSPRARSQEPGATSLSPEPAAHSLEPCSTAAAMACETCGDLGVVGAGTPCGCELGRTVGNQLRVIADADPQVWTAHAALDHGKPTT